ncbi:MAG TPA: tRNA (adenosine(37)-N6)-threonylcarbamoyltransferase complex ATPase subunit type 1 TsaE, partial [Mizugakiibacter sp.]|nr:tRNA (adenosine(37)-N6)-threonylcarbamoyltransferase complex ATPase subunit type 1 TsaE [Mizugakiibacter sp.]
MPPRGREVNAVCWAVIFSGGYVRAWERDVAERYTVFLAGPEATTRLAERLAAVLHGGVIYLQGELGAGKTSFARALLQTLGVTGRIKSPTYSLLESYRLPQGTAWHLDLYRIA